MARICFQSKFCAIVGVTIFLVAASSAVVGFVLHKGNKECLSSRVAKFHANGLSRGKPRDFYSQPGQLAIADEKDDNVLPDEKEKLEALEKLIDAGDYRNALAVARDLMDSRSRYVKHELVANLGHIGAPALSELVELQEDQHLNIAVAAELMMDHILNEISNEKTRADTILSLVAEQSKGSTINCLLQRLYAMDEKIALSALSDFIKQEGSGLSGECAREAFEYISEGVPWQSGESYPTKSLQADANAANANQNLKGGKL